MWNFFPNVFIYRLKVSYLGHVISVNCMRADPEKTTSIVLWSHSKDAHQFWRFLGVCTYYRRFLKCFSCISKPLHKLTESSKKRLWADEYDDAFLKLKETLRSNSCPDRFRVRVRVCSINIAAKFLIIALENYNFFTAPVFIFLFYNWHIETSQDKIYNEHANVQVLKDSEIAHAEYIWY